MKRFVKALSEFFVRKELAESGIGTSARPVRGDPHIRVLVPNESGGYRLVGTLTQEGAEFVFQYASGYRSDNSAEPLPAFPDKDEVYRSNVLFPFFAVRLPSLDRPDIREAMKEKDVSEDDLLRLLGRLARKGITNPYEFELTERPA